jgi:predicted metalloprotease with PDZ domain
MFYDGIVRNSDAVRNNPAYSEIGPNEASLRVSEAENGRGNSNGFKISYYNLGWLGGFCLDTEIRYQTHNRHSLDDVVHALYDLCKDNRPGFEEDEIRKQCVRFGGPNLGPFYDKVILQAGQMPIEAQLAKMGLEMVETNQPFVDIGFAAAPNRGGKGLRVSAVRAAATGHLETGDMILSINGQSMDTDDFMVLGRAIPSLEANAAVGKPIALQIRRGDQTMEVEVNPVSATRKIHTVQEDPAATKSAIGLREGWLKTKTPSAM